jgi:hypothetical protein
MHSLVLRWSFLDYDALLTGMMTGMLMCRFKDHFRWHKRTELDGIVPLLVMVVEDTPRQIMADSLLARMYRVDEMDKMDITHPQVPNVDALLAQTKIAVNTAQTSSVMHAGKPAMLQQTAVSLPLPSLSKSINGTSQTT